MTAPSDDKRIRIAPSKDKPGLSKTQKRFNELLQKVEEEKARLQAWQDTLPQYHRRIAEEYDVQWDRYNDLREELVTLFDAACGDKRYTKSDRKKLERLIVTVSAELIVDHGRDALKEIHDRHSDRPFDELRREAVSERAEDLKSALHDMFGIETEDDAEIDTPEKLEEFLHAKMRDAAERDREMRRKTEERQAKRKKTPKRLEKEAKEKQAMQDIERSVREIYRKLASELHPDREPEPAERERKTELMQRVNAAYEKKDMVKLLELQLEIEQIDPKHLQNMAEERLKYCNKLLSEQLKELARENAEIARPFALQFGLPPFAHLTPAVLMQYLERDIRDVKQNVAQLRRDLKDFRQPDILKAWIKRYKIPKRRPHDDLDDFMFGGDLF